MAHGPNPTHRPIWPVNWFLHFKMVEKESKEYFMTHGKYTQFTFQYPER